ncbi:putative hydrolase YdeN [Streptomyces sp. YIM 130001]|uniref:RBBP9/YdeN family alpha/beta hydrolase n=1 Tax=Streptomyces sp. YIM 130001 TaxID=2259644 RepID=UPI000E65C2FA|nr:alpha/beta hydrolase [Streptomyces sp. YIM 130001]RII09174.1 putative hydrolase YdeN [Streptomyces sp. YIM 130001]
MTNGTTPRHATIFHGYGATPDDHWFGWLAGRLAADGIETTVPPLPDPQSPDTERWAEALRAELATPARDSAVIAHSLGTVAVLRHLAGLPGSWRLGTLVLVAGFVDRLPALPELDAFIGGAFADAGRAEAAARQIAARVDRIAVIRSDADPLVPTGHTDRLAGLLGTDAQVVPGAGHFLASDGATELPEAYAAVRAGREAAMSGLGREAGMPGR